MPQGKAGRARRAGASVWKTSGITGGTAMTSLSFETTRRVYCEPGASTKLGALMAELGATRVMLVTDPGVMKLGLPDAALASLKAAGIAVARYDRTEDGPPDRLAHEGAAAARAPGTEG